MSIRNQILASAADYIVVNDGQFAYPILRAAAEKAGADEAAVRGMNGDEYAAWCQDVPADLRAGDVGTSECIALCNDLICAGAACWHVG